MEKISKNNYRNYISWAKENIANMVYPCSIAEGFQSGDIYVNDGVNVESVFFWHYCGFGYISGKASDKLLDDIYFEMISGQNGRRLVLITADDDVTAFFRGRDVMMDLRAEYFYLHPGSATAIGTDKFRIEPIDTDNISKIEGRIIPSFSWDSSEQFEALRLLTDKEERRDLEPGAQLLPGTGHLKWRHVYVIMTTEFDHFEHDHILYTVGNNCKKRKKYPSCCAMLALPHFSSVRKPETVKPGEEIMLPLPQSITILLSSDKILSGFMKSIARGSLFAMLHVRNPTGSCMKQQKEAL